MFYDNLLFGKRVGNRNNEYCTGGADHFADDWRTAPAGQP